MHSHFFMLWRCNTHTHTHTHEFLVRFSACTCMMDRFQKHWRNNTSTKFKPWFKLTVVKKKNLRDLNCTKAAKNSLYAGSSIKKQCAMDFKRLCYSRHFLLCACLQQHTCFYFNLASVALQLVWALDPAFPDIGVCLWPRACCPPIPLKGCWLFSSGRKHFWLGSWRWLESFSRGMCSPCDI
jgi:hypothetical protein